MGATKVKNGDQHIVFHVGKELPEKGDNFLIGIGRQNAQGRGVYCSEEPDLKYEGSEHYRKELPITPIFCIPMSGKWRKGQLKKKNNEVVMHTEGRLVGMKNLRYQDFLDPRGKILRYYFSNDISFFPEPETKIFDEFSVNLRQGNMSSDEGLRRLEGEFNIQPESTDPTVIIEKLSAAMEEGRMPKMKDLMEGTRFELAEIIQNPEFRELRDLEQRFEPLN